MDFSTISKYRSELMGVAILMIMFFHTRYPLYRFCNIGVEFFLILSAIGLDNSLTNNSDPKRFYKKRLVRLLPAYLLVSFPYWLYTCWPNMSQFFQNISGISLFSGVRTFWFIILITFCYIITPFYFKYTNRKAKLILPFLLIFPCFGIGLAVTNVEILVNRIPVFLLGFIVADYLKRRKEINVTLLFLLSF